ncbi:MAG: ABA4-like family protein [Leptolyngbyaceae cyanobacterium bins.59]|nr:ABA4-like family protein [Leptolyngbyaceae cyanobacterium bins.59]
MTVDLLFNIANLYVLPFWALMILLPKWGVTRKVMESLLPFLPLAGLYVYWFATSLNSEAAQALANPQAADIARFFSEEKAAATGWVHFLVMDLVAGRWIYWEGQKSGVWTVHSLVLCLFAGPLGVLSHIFTRWISQRFAPAPTEETATPSPSV